MKLSNILCLVSEHQLMRVYIDDLHVAGDAGSLYKFLNETVLKRLVGEMMAENGELVVYLGDEDE